MTEQLQVTERPTGGLMPYARNALNHPEEQVVQIVASIAEFEFVNSMLIDAEGGIIAGHGRVLADNRIQENAGWDSDGLDRAVRRLHGILSAAPSEIVVARPGPQLPLSTRIPPSFLRALRGFAFLLRGLRVSLPGSTTRGLRGRRGVGPALGPSLSFALSSWSPSPVRTFGFKPQTIV